DKLALREAIERVQLLLEQPPRGTARARASVARQATAVVQTYRRAENAKNDFVKANLRLVVCLAQRYNHGALPFADLVQEGNLGLMKAVDRFDHRRGYRFSTYATWWIRHAIQRALADKGRAIRLPVHLLDSRHRVTRWKRILEGRLGREPTAEELSVASGIVPEKLAALESVSMHQPISLDSPLGDEDDDRKLIDLVRDPNAAGRTVADDLGDRAMVQEMLAQLRKLKPVEADILRQRFGLDTGEEQTLAEIGQKYRLSRERIRQLQEQALGKLQQALRRKGLS
ncbi:MAG TPA: sigma-70 family RNA polymerase sigma factor, partial [Polyangia bacterium]|nr:sigma-70 family RNA polymerase sigma factor [Polyangia bacterium]